MTGCAQAHEPGFGRAPLPTYYRTEKRGIESLTTSLWVRAQHSFPSRLESHERPGPPRKLICSRLIAPRSSVTEEPQVIGRR